jgi:hypothetical protein
MFKAIYEFLTGHPWPIRSREDANTLRLAALHNLNRDRNFGDINCPWCATGIAWFNKTSNHVECRTCHRSTDIDTLNIRLLDPTVYRYEVK